MKDRISCQRGLLVLCALLLAGCSTTQQTGPVIIEDRTGTQPSIQPQSEPSESTIRTAPLITRPAEPTSVDGSTSAKTQSPAPQPVISDSPAVEPTGAVLALLEQAETQHQQGQNQQALTSLERAQRIAPRQPLVYLQLARLHQDMGDTDRAEQFARRGKSLASGDARLQDAFNSLLQQLSP